ncbi:uncharacterized protein [Prorops nasuta]|uniref:uncharacterized protein isoform X2 n=1 Tax=Prorops nasuta TaxID=863751 RepID=UPI0034CEC294
MISSVLFKVLIVFIDAFRIFLICAIITGFLYSLHASIISLENMFCALKTWGERFLIKNQRTSNKRKGRLGSSTTQNIKNRLSSIVHLPVNEDPRELPRPREDIEDKQYRDNNKHKFGRWSKNSECKNCESLAKFAECTICLQSLRGRKIECCVTCANLVCEDCARRLPSCAFCRSVLPTQRNRAMERLLENLVLPCKNAGYGCRTLVSGESGLNHEAICCFNLMTCPINIETCNWRGSAIDAENHFKVVHDLLPLTNTAGIAMEIYHFREKAFYQNFGRLYMTCLRCYEQLFAVKIIVLQGKLKLIFYQMGYVRPVTERYSFVKYTASVQIYANGRSFCESIILSKSDTNQEINFACHKLYQGVTGEDTDSIKINISIKRLKPSNIYAC